MNYRLRKTSAALISVFMIAGCLPAGESTTRRDDADDGTTDRYLYVASGQCYAGNGNTSYTTTSASNLVYRINLADGGRDSILADYWGSPSNVGDSPVGITVSGGDLYVLVENSTTASLRRIDKITNEANGARSIHNNNITALSGVGRRMVKTIDDYFLVSKSTDLEKVKDGTIRQTTAGAAFIRLATTASNCITATTLLSDMVVLPSGHIVVLHAAAGKTGFAVISSSGYAAAADCKNNVFQASPSANGYPTAAVFDSANNKLLVAYAGSTTLDNVNAIYAYTLNPTTGAISAPQEIYDSVGAGSTWNYTLYGITTMALDSTTNSLYVATAKDTATTANPYKIEKLTYNAAAIGTANSTVLLKDSTFYNYGNDTRCISQMVIN